MQRVFKFFLLLSVLLALGGLALADTVQVGSGNSTFNYLPIYTLYSYNYTQQIYTQEQINHTGEISAIRFFYTTGVISASKDWKIYMGHTTRTSFNGTADWEPIANLSLVYDGDVSPFLPAQNNWMNIPLDTPFDYNNTSNLIIAVYEDTPSYSSTISWGSFTSTANAGIYFYSDSIMPNPESPPTANSVTSNIAQIQLVFPNTSAPFAPVLVFPANGEEVFTNAVLRWQPGYGAGEPSSYDLYFGTSPNPPLLAANLTATSYAPQLQGDTTYYWKVVAHNAIGSSPASPIWSFTTAPPGVIQIGDGTNNTYRPFCTLYGYERSAAIYNQSQIGTYGLITRLAWSVSNTGSTVVPYKIWLKTVDSAILTPQTWDDLIDGAVMVKEGTHTFNSTGWHNFILDIPFVYASGNLLIGVQSDYGGSGTGGYPYLHYTTNPGQVHQTWSQDGSASTNNGSLNTNLPNIIMHVTPPTGDPAFMVNPSSYDYAEVRLGSNKTKNFTITNVGGGNLVVNSISISGNPAFTLSNLPTLPASLATIENTTFTVNFAPTVLGAANATITITDNLGNRSEHTVAVSGTGAQHLIIGQGSTNLYMPVNAYYGYTYSQSIYLQSEISTQDQRIERLAYYWNGEGPGDLSNGWTIYMGHTSQTTFNNVSGWIPISELTQVYSGQPNITATAGWIEVLLNMPFVYNNTDNLVIAVHENTPNYDGYGQYFHCTNASTNRSLRFYSDGTNPDPASPPAGTLVAGFPNIKVNFGDIPTSPVLAIQPDALNFGMCTQNLASMPLSVMLMNHGLGTLNLTAADVSVVGTDAAMFSLVTTSLPAALSAGQQILVGVIFNPTSEGAKSATFRVVYNGQNHDVALSGYGLPLGTVTVGTGAESSSYPFYSLYEDARTQMLFTVDELMAAGALPGQFIEHIAFNVASVNPATLNSLMIRLKTTAATGLSGFDTDNTSFSTCYQANYAIPATGWVYFEFADPYFWNGGENLLVDVSFDNTSWTSNSVVYATTEIGKTWAANQDGATGSTLTGGYAQSVRPNTRFIFTGNPGAEPSFFLSPNAYNFGDVNIGGSKSKSFNIINVGGGTLGITNISISGSNAMNLGATPNLPVYLEMAQMAQFEVVYSPNMLGTDNATVIITDDQNNRHILGRSAVFALADSQGNSRDTHSLALSGNGVNDITLGDGSATARMPLDFYYKASIHETIFTNAEMNNFVGMITGIRLYNNFATSLPQKPVKIWMGGTNATDLTAGWIPASDLELVFDGDIDFPNGENVINITFPEPYLHLDGSNLVLLFKRPLDASYFSSMDLFKCQAGAQNRARNMMNDSMDYDENSLSDGTLTSTYPKITFTVIPGGVGHINGTVLGPDAQPLPGVTVTMDGRPISVQTNHLGFFAIPNQLPGNYSLTFSKHTYVTQTLNIALEEDETEVLNITMAFMPRVDVSGTVLASDTGQGIAGAQIRFTGYETFTGSTSASGSFTIPNVFANQAYHYLISATGYVSTSGDFNLAATNHNMGNITLAEIAYSPNSVIAEPNDNYTAINLSWNAPDPNAVEIIESFEDDLFPPAGWSQVITNTSAPAPGGLYPTWCSVTTVNAGNGYITPTEGVKQAGIKWVTEHQDEWLKTPTFNCPPDAYLSFDTHATCGSEAGDHYYVKISTNGGNSWIALWDASALPAGENHYQSPITIDLAPYAGSEVILAFHAVDPPSNDGLWYDWFIDNIYIGNMVHNLQLGVSHLSQGKKLLHSAKNASIGRGSIGQIDTGNSRSLIGYKVWRLAAGQENNEATWVALTDEVLGNPAFTDENWPNLPNGSYKWAVKAVYTANVISAPAISNVLVKEQLNGFVVGFLRRSNGQGIPGGTITASNGTTATTNNAGNYSMVLPVGTYSFVASANGYHPLTQDDITVVPNQNTTLNFVMIPMDNEDEVIPIVATALKGNYPNPFNPETTISYDLKDAAPVRLDIYNLKGQLVRSLVNEVQASGRYKIVFHGKDDRNLALPSGVYLYRFSAGDYRKTQKMMLMQ